MTTLTLDDAKLYEVEDGKIKLNFHAGQRAVYRSKARFIFMLAGTQGGKTSFGTWWLRREIDRIGRGDYLAVTSSYDLFKLKMLPEIREVFENVLMIGRYWRGDKVMEIADPDTGEFWASKADDPMYARIILRSAVARAGLESATAKAAWLDEVGQNEFTLDAWEAIRRRLSLSRGRVLGTTTLYNTGWMKQQIYDRWRAGDEDIEVVQFASIENPAFPKQEFEDVQATTASWKFSMQYRGEYDKPAGMIYGDYIDELVSMGGHVVHDFAVPNWWPIYVGIDPGGANHAKLWLAYDPREDILYAFRESLTGGLPTSEHVKEVKSYWHDVDGKRVEQFAGAYIGARSETQVRYDYINGGLSPVFAPKIVDVEGGIDRVIALLKTRRLLVFWSLSRLRDEFGRYSRKLDSAGEPTDQIDDKNAFHMLDALRYGSQGIMQHETEQKPAVMRIGMQRRKQLERGL